jgi:hypothetical protein
MKRLLVTLALTCALSGVALGGDIPTGGCPSPAPGETQTPPCLMGDMGNGGKADDGNQGSGGLALLIVDLLF